MPAAIIEMLNVVALRHDDDALDRLIWRNSPSGQLTVKGAYQTIRVPLDDVADDI